MRRTGSCRSKVTGFDTPIVHVWSREDHGWGQAMLTQHAVTRCQQRGISAETVDVLLTFGRRRFRHGAEICFMDRSGRQKAEETLGRPQFARIADRLNSYVVVSDEGSVITAVPRRRRLKF